MAYNNYFPQTYTSSPYVFSGATPAQTWTAPQPAQPINQLSGINWVQGESGARSVSVPAGQKIMLMDSETNIFYVKSSDVSGMPLPLRKFEYKEIDTVASGETTAPAQSEYVTHEELDRIIADLKPQSQSQSQPKEEKKNEFII